jgi:hypothetical protein
MYQRSLFARFRLPKDAVFQAPVILKQFDCITVIEPGDTVRQDALGNLLITIG